MGLKEPSSTIPVSYTSRYIGLTVVDSIPVALLVGWILVGKASAKEREYLISSSFTKDDWSFVSSINIPWPEKGMGDAEYLHAFMKVVMPIAMEFAPELVISTYR